MKKWKHLLKTVMAVGVIAMTAVQICAAAEGTAQAAVSEITPVSISTNEISGWPAGPEITSETGVLMDADSGTLLYSKGGDEIRYPASITKIMTLLLAVENCSLKEDVVFTETGTRDISWDSGNIGMQVGEVMSMRACLYALVIRSANEVAAQIAEHVGGTEQHFVDMMNERAAQIAKRQKYRRIIFISGTDSARAPMAAEMLRHEDLAQEYVIDSRGLVVLFPEPANQKAEAIMKSAQMTLENHVSRQLEPETLVEDTLVLTIEEAEKNKILSEYGTKANVYTLNEFVGSDGEIPNPYGKPLTAYGECYEILRELIKELAEKLNYIAEEE